MEQTSAGRFSVWVAGWPWSRTEASDGQLSPHKKARVLADLSSRIGLRSDLIITQTQRNGSHESLLGSVRNSMQTPAKKNTHRSFAVSNPRPPMTNSGLFETSALIRTFIWYRSIVSGAQIRIFLFLFSIWKFIPVFSHPHPELLAQETGPFLSVRFLMICERLLRPHLCHCELQGHCVAAEMGTISAEEVSSKSFSWRSADLFNEALATDLSMIVLCINDRNPCCSPPFDFSSTTTSV